MLQEALRTIAGGRDLSREGAAAVMEALMSGNVTDAQTGALLVALRMKGESVAEIAGFATAMRSHALLVKARREPLLDTCGTGGSSFRTFNISTAAAFVAAAMGVAVAKHGNRAATGVCGSADVLEALGVRVDITPEQCAECIDTVGIGFLYARTHHPSMKHVSSIRRELGVRTIFNLLGPLSNPAGTTLQVMGVYDPELCPLAIGALRELGAERALVIHADPGMDELSTFTRNRVCELRDGIITDNIMNPDELGYYGPAPDPSHLAPACTLEANAKMLREALGEGSNSAETESRRGIVALNAAAALRVGGVAGDWPGAVCLARDTIERGSALQVLDGLIEFTKSFTGTGSIDEMSMLSEILATKRTEVSIRSRRFPLDELEKRIADAAPSRDFASALECTEDLAVIAEVKKASPSKGVIRENFDPLDIARIYAENGAACLSVLTDEAYFQGKLEYLSNIREIVDIPILRKDFIVDSWQIAESRAAGADAILLIVAALCPDDLRRHLNAAKKYGVSALVEVHDQAELAEALSADAKLIGINNRDLHTFRSSLTTTFELMKMLPEDPELRIVSESGICNRCDMVNLRNAGVHAALVGESLMREADIGAKLRELRCK